MMMRIQNDEPADADSLGRSKFADALAQVIRTCDTPLVIGLYGAWGIGKTSLMRQIQQLVADPESIRTIWFDPWQHQFDEDPAIALLHTMVDQLDLGDEGKKLLTVIAGALGSLLLRATTTLGTTDLQTLGERYEEERFQIREKQVKLKSYFNGLIERASENGNKRLVFFIDDLDRCVPEQVLKTLEALKLYLSLKDCVYVMGVDRSALECSIRQRYKDHEVKEADYLDKIVQLPFAIPPIARKSMRQFIQPMLHAELADLLDMLIVGLGENPRQVKRFLNTLQLNHALASKMMGAGYDPKILGGVLLVQYRQPELFKAAALNPSILLDLSRKDSAASSASEDMLKGDAPLSEVIKTIDFKSVEVIASYIFLTEVVSVRQVLFDVVVDALGSDKIAAIKVIREFTGLGLAEAKTLVESAPFVARGSMERDQAEKMLSMLLATGASASLR